MDLGHRRDMPPRRPPTLSRRKANEARSRLRKVLLWTLRSVVGLHAVFLVVRLTLRDYFGIIHLLAGLMPYTALSLAVLAPVCVALRDRCCALLCGLLLCFPLFSYGRMFLPGRSADAPGDLRVATFNVESLDDHGPGDPLFEAFAEQLERLRADVVVLQEMDPESFGRLRERVAGTYPHSAIIAEAASGSVLSRREILGMRAIASLPWGPRGISCTVSTPKGRVKLIGIHACPPPFLSRQNPLRYDYHLRDGMNHRRKLVAAFLSHVDDPMPAVLAGDLNFTQEAKAYRLMAGRLKDAHAEVGFGLGNTWPANRFCPPVFRIDYVFVSEHITPISCRTHQINGSDHRLVVAELRIGK